MATRAVVIGSADAVGVDRVVGVSIDGRADSVTVDEFSFQSLASVPGSTLIAVGEDIDGPYLDVRYEDVTRRRSVSSAVASAFARLLAGE